MTKICEYFQGNRNTQFSIEILPPVKGQSINDLYKKISPLMEFKPKFVDVTYHREEYVYKECPGGLLDKKVIRKRPGTVGICAAIMNKFQVETVPHIICGGFSKEETENALIDLNFLGINNVLALRGDAIKSEQRFHPHPEGHPYALNLVEQVKDLNDGKYLDENLKGSPTNFCIGIAGYPEKHFEAPNMQSDIYYLKKKIEAGASYIITQMFFDNKKYFDFVAKCREEGITVPIIPGLKPLTSLKQLITLPSYFYIDIPEELHKEVMSCTNPDEVKAVGIKWCIQQSQELKAANVPCLHYYSMGRSTHIAKIAKEIF